MDILIKIAQLFLCFTILVGIHELGHFLMARAFKIRVEKFYIFFDPWFSLFKFKRGDTEYGLGWLPLGGYVKIAGMIDESMDKEQMKQPVKPDEFRAKPAWQRLLVMVAGVMMNVLLAIVIYCAVCYTWGDSYFSNQDAKWGYNFNPTAHEMGFRDGDRFVSIDGEEIDNMTQALERAVANGVKNLVVQPTHLMHGAEYDEMCAAIDDYRDNFDSVSIAEPLLGEVGSDATVINADKEAVAKAITAAAVEASGFDSLEAAKEAGAAFVFLGHGTAHVARVSYSQMSTQMQQLGYENVFIGTVEGEPEETACESVIEEVRAAGYTTVILRPLMVVAGDHANNDMAGSDDDSWKLMFEDAGLTVDCQIAGLGGIADIQALYIAHTQAAIDSLNA